MRLFEKSQTCYLEELVAREEVGGGLQDGGHGFSQLLVHGPRGVGDERLGLEHKLAKAHSEKMLSLSQNKQPNNTEMSFYLYVRPQVVL